jgi:iron(III) transport system substrate-binding protein
MRGRAIRRGRGVRRWLAMVTVLGFVAAACGDDGGSSTSATTTVGSPTATTATATTANAAWTATLEAAKKEGKVTIYSSQGLDQLNDLKAKFEKAYPGITVEVVRGIDSDLQPKVEAEKTTGKGIADVFVNASQPWVVDHSKQGYYTPVSGPAFNEKIYDKATRIPEGTYWEVGAAILTFGWNKSLYPKGIKDYSDLLASDLGGGKIGVINPAAQSIVDFYMYLEENFGTDFVTKLAAQKPRIYPSSLPMGQAVVSGEIAVGSFVQPLIDEKANGAPVEWALSPKSSWGARFWGQVLASAPHPNAAQVLANYMVTAEGQGAVQRKAASVLPDITGTLTSTNSVRRQDLTKLTPESVKSFQDKFKSLFT